MISASALMSDLGPSLTVNESLLDAYLDVCEASTALGIPHDSLCCLVFEAKEPVGFLFGDDVLSDNEEDEGNTTLRDRMRPFDEAKAIPSDTGFLSLASEFAQKKRTWFFVLEQERVGVVHYWDLFSFLGRIGFLALTLTLEEMALRVLLHDTHRWGACLKVGRREAAVKAFKERSPSRVSKPPVTASDWLPFTSFIDKAEMLVHCFRGQGDCEVDFRRVLRKAERLRNACAHTEGEARLRQVAGTPATLDVLLRGIRGAMDTLRSELQRLETQPEVQFAAADSAQRLRAKLGEL